MRRVLLPIDGSDCALHGVNLVISERSLYAKPDALQIHLINVQPPLSRDVTRFVSSEQAASFQREESENLMRSACELLDAAKVAYTCHYEVGPVAETITNLANMLDCDEIVMGTHGRGALRDLLMGSITLKIVHLSKVPVVLVK